MAETIKNGLMSVMLEGRKDYFQNFINTMVVEEVEAIRLMRPDGTVIDSSLASEAGEKSRVVVTAGIPAWQEGDRYHVQVPLYNEKHCRTCHPSGGEIMGILGVEFLLKNTERKIGMLRKRTLLLYLVTLVVLSVSLSVMTTMLVNKPVRAMMHTMKQVAGGDLNVRFITGRKDEVGMLASSLNSMLAELQRTRRELDTCHFDAMQRVEKMATIGELAAAVAHEIKNPLAGISGAIQVLAEDFPPGDPRRGIIVDVLNEIDRLDKAVRDLLSFARPPEPHFVRVSITPVIERAVRLVAAQAKKQGVRINMMTAEDTETFRLDPELMQQVFLNMFMNALHSMPGGGALTISSFIRDGVGEVVVSDTGEGIPQEEIKNIFKPFFTTKHTGTGLGLAISKKLVEKHGGEITVESRPGFGSTFRVLLPLEVESA